MENVSILYSMSVDFLPRNIVVARPAYAEIEQQAFPSKVLTGNLLQCFHVWSCDVSCCTVLGLQVHVLFHLMCVWSISFRALFLFQPSKRVQSGSGSVDK